MLPCSRHVPLCYSKPSLSLNKGVSNKDLGFVFLIPGMWPAAGCGLSTLTRHVACRFMILWSYCDFLFHSLPQKEQNRGQNKTSEPRFVPKQRQYKDQDTRYFVFASNPAAFLNFLIPPLSFEGRTSNWPWRTNSGLLSRAHQACGRSRLS